VPGRFYSAHTSLSARSLPKGGRVFTRPEERRHRWFAWYPVTLRNGRLVWLRFVERKWDNGDATGELHWRYRRAKWAGITQ
jgi:hypothetical protein